MNDFDKEFSEILFSSQARQGRDGDATPMHGIGQLLRRAYYKALEHSSQTVKPFDLTTRQAAAIREIAARGNMSQVELGAAIGMEPANVHGLVERLKKKGLISAERDLENPRRMRLLLTAQGAGLVEPLNMAKQVSEDLALRPLDAGERERLCQLLAKMIS